MSESLSTNKIFAEGHNDLQQLMLESNNPILVKFVAPHCPSCKTLAPVLQQLVTDFAGKIVLVTIDMTEYPDLTIELGVRSAPTVMLIKGEEILERIPGLKPKKLYVEAIQRAIDNG